MRRLHFSAMLICSLQLFWVKPGSAENWPQWRGPTGNGISRETGIAREWANAENAAGNDSKAGSPSPTRSRNIAWRLPLPGPAGATPIVWEDRIFITSSVGNENGGDLVLLCASTNGEKVWQVKVGDGNLTARTTEGNSASPTPVTDGKHVWTFFGTGIFACYDFEGTEVWKFDVQDRYGKFDIQFGMSSTPVLDGEHLYLQLLHGTWRGDYLVQKVVKLDKATGDEVWAVDRNPEPGMTKSNMEETKHSYASPILYDDGKLKFLVTHGADATVGHALEDGHEVWRLGALNGPSAFNAGQFDPTFRFVASPTAVPGVIATVSAKNGPSLALKVDADLAGRVDQRSDHVLFVNDKTPDVSCPLIVDGLVYFVRRNGPIYCVDLASGEELYYENAKAHRHEHRSSPVYCDGHIYVTARDGHTTVLKAGRKFEIVAGNDLGEPMTSTPVISNGTLYMRTYDALYAIRQK